MDLKQFSQSYQVDINKLIEYQKVGLIDSHEIENEKIEKIQLILTMDRLQISYDQIRQYLIMDNASRIEFLKKLRKEYLNEIHDKEKILSEIDILIYKQKRED